MVKKEKLEEFFDLMEGRPVFLTFLGPWDYIKEEKQLRFEDKIVSYEKLVSSHYLMDGYVGFFSEDSNIVYCFLTAEQRYV